MRKISACILFVSLCLLAGTALAGSAETKLYKDYFFGQQRAEIQQIPGMRQCDQTGDLCLPGQPFAGYSWVQRFAFFDGQLVQVTLVGKLDQGRYYKAFGAILNNGYLPVILQSGDHTFDFLAVAHASGKDAAVHGLNDFEQKALRAGHVLYTLIPNDAIPLAKEDDSFSSFLLHCPPDMRTVEVEVRDAWMAVRFFVAQKARKVMSSDMMQSKDSF